MEVKDYNVKNADVAWCPGCGNFFILNVLKKTLAELDIEPRDLVIVSGIGQAGKTPHYLKCNLFNGLHGRALPAAIGIKSANSKLTVIAESGDGCMYGEGGNHFLHAIRRNPDITLIVHNNMVYGLTKGQASPTSSRGFKTPVQLKGVADEPFNPIAAALSQNISFAARAYCKDIKETTDILKKAVNHKGFALVDLLQPCVTYNKLNTYKWFDENTYYLRENYRSDNRVEAFKKSLEKEKVPLGVFYEKERETFDERVVSENIPAPLFRREVKSKRLIKLLESKKEAHA